MDRETIKDVATLKEQVKTLSSDVKELKEGYAEWQNFCVRAVIKSTLILLSVLTLGTFWGYLTPEMKSFIEVWSK